MDGQLRWSVQVQPNFSENFNFPRECKWSPNPPSIRTVKYNFEGVWDAAGKVVKNYMRNSELTDGSDNQFAMPLIVA
jgi:hypothetical protein